MVAAMIAMMLTKTIVNFSIYLIIDAKTSSSQSTLMHTSIIKKRARFLIYPCVGLPFIRQGKLPELFHYFFCDLAYVAVSHRMSVYFCNGHDFFVAAGKKDLLCGA